MNKSSLEDELLYFPHGSIPTTSVIYSRLHDLYPAYGLDVCKVVKLSFIKCAPTKQTLATAAAQKLLNFVHKIRQNSGYVYYLVVAKSIGYPDKVVKLYRLDLRHKLKSRRLPNRSDIYRQQSVSHTVSRPRTSTTHSIEMMRLSSDRNLKLVHSESRSSTTRPIFPNPNPRPVRTRRMSKGYGMDEEHSSGISAGLVLNTHGADLGQSRSDISSPLQRKSKRLSLSLSNSSSNDNLLTAVDRITSPKKFPKDPSLESYSNSGSDDSEKIRSYNALRCIAVYPTDILIDQPDKSKRGQAATTKSSPQRTNRRSRHLNNASRRCIANIQESLKLSLDDTVFKFRSRQDVCDIFKSVFEYQ